MRTYACLNRPNPPLPFRQGFYGYDYKKEDAGCTGCKWRKDIGAGSGD